MTFSSQPGPTACRGRRAGVGHPEEQAGSFAMEVETAREVDRERHAFWEPRRWPCEPDSRRYGCTGADAHLSCDLATRRPRRRRPSWSRRPRATLHWHTTSPLDTNSRDPSRSRRRRRERALRAA
jgi:hypothetical protein